MEAADAPAKTSDSATQSVAMAALRKGRGGRLTDRPLAAAVDTRNEGTQRHVRRYSLNARESVPAITRLNQHLSNLSDCGSVSITVLTQKMPVKTRFCWRLSDRVGVRGGGHGVRPPARGFGDNGATLPGAPIEATRRPAVGVGSNACRRPASVVAGVGRREDFVAGLNSSSGSRGVWASASHRSVVDASGPGAGVACVVRRPTLSSLTGRPTR